MEKISDSKKGGLLSQANVKSKGLKKSLKERSSSFTANLSVMVNANTALSKCDPNDRNIQRPLIAASH